MNLKWGRLYKADSRDRKFLMHPDMKKAERVPYRYWYIGQPLDQRDTPACVGFSGYKYLTSGPVRNIKLPFSPNRLYVYAQENDEWPGEDYQGSSVRGLFKFFNKEGYTPKYQWTDKVETLVAQILTVGPVVLGTDWYDGMLETDSKGFIKPTGRVLGGHAYLTFGANQKQEKIAIINSWGPKFGLNGRAWIRFDDMQKLLDHDGECCIATEARLLAFLESLNLGSIIA